MRIAFGGVDRKMDFAAVEAATHEMRWAKPDSYHIVKELKEAGVDPIWLRLANGKPSSEDVVQLLMLGGIPGVCGPGRTAKERETILNHSRGRLEIVNNLWLTPAGGAHARRRTGQTMVNGVPNSEEELTNFFGRAFPSDSRGRIGARVFILYFLAFATLAGWMYFAVPSTLAHLEAIPAFLGGEWLASAHDWFDAPDWVWWASVSAIGVRALVFSSALVEPDKKTANTHAAWSWFRFLIFGLLWDILMVLYLRRTDTSVNNWDSDSIGHRVGTFFLVLVGVPMVGVWLASIFNANSASADSPGDVKIQARKIAKDDWRAMLRSARSILRVEDATWELEKGAGLVEMLEGFLKNTKDSENVNLDQMAKCLFKLVLRHGIGDAVEHRTYVTDKYAAMVWLCIGALRKLPEDQRNPKFALSTICSFGVTVYDCFSSIEGWYVVEPALAPVIASTTGREKKENPSPFSTDNVKAGFAAFRVHQGHRTTSMGRAYVETSGRGEAGPSFHHRGEGSVGRPYPSGSVDVRVSIPMRPQAFVSKPEHTGLLGLVNTAAALWFLVHWEPDAYHAFLAAAVCGEAWAQLWIWIWWCAGEAPLSAFVDPVHWLVGRREHVPAGAVRLLAGEASAAVLGVVAALSVVDSHIAGGVVGTSAVVVGAVLKKLLKREEDLAVVCF